MQIKDKLIKILLFFLDKLGYVKEPQLTSKDFEIVFGINEIVLDVQPVPYNSENPTRLDLLNKHLGYMGNIVLKPHFKTSDIQSCPNLDYSSAMIKNEYSLKNIKEQHVKVINLVKNSAIIQPKTRK